MSEQPKPGPTQRFTVIGIPSAEAVSSPAPAAKRPERTKPPAQPPKPPAEGERR